MTSKQGILLSQRKYVLDMLSETGNWVPNLVAPLWLLMYNSLRNENYSKILRDTEDWLGN